MQLIELAAFENIYFTTGTQGFLLQLIMTINTIDVKFLMSLYNCPSSWLSRIIISIIKLAESDVTQNTYRTVDITNHNEDILL